MLPRLHVRALVSLLAVAAVAAPPTHKRSVDRLFEGLKKSPPELYAFLLRMPKGGDLHNHLSGAVYAESFLDRAASAPLCVTPGLTLTDPVNGSCAENQTAGSQLPGNEVLWNQLIDSLSMRGFVPTTQEMSADHFFNTFSKFGAASHIDEGGEVAEIATRAYTENVAYLELMALTAPRAVSDMGTHAGLAENDFDTTRRKLLDAGLADKVKVMGGHVDAIEKGRREKLLCDADPPRPACSVDVRYEFQVLRNSPKEQVFAQALAGFLLANSDPRVAAVNFVQREDGYNSLHDYDLHMRIIAYLRKLYPKVHLTLHAGELTEGLVPPEDLRFHIHDAVFTAGAERIGHGVDIMDETDSLATLTYMREHHIDVEINLTSNDLILGVKGDQHPFPVYRKYGVPVTLSTDDPGVSRGDLTAEYERAVLTYGLTYADVKQLAHNSIAYSFATAEQKARLQTDLDRRFHDFEKWATTSFR